MQSRCLKNKVKMIECESQRGSQWDPQINKKRPGDLSETILGQILKNSCLKGLHREHFPRIPEAEDKQTA